MTKLEATDYLVQRIKRAALRRTNAEAEAQWEADIIQQAQYGPRQYQYIDVPALDRSHE
jgi:hypothetical protein